MTHSHKLRVCILAPSAEYLGGQARQAIRLIEGFRLETSLAVSFIPHNPKFRGVFQWLQRIKYVRTVVTSLWYWTVLCFKIPSCDVVHVFSASYLSYLLAVAPAILIGKLFGKKVVLNYRSGEADDHLTRWPITTVPIMRLADAIIVPSGYLVNVFARFGLHAKAIVNTVELIRFRFRDRQPFQPIFLTSRSLEPLYNVPCVLRAFALIQAQVPSARFIVAGSGSLRRELEILSQELGLFNLEFRGGVPFDAMPELYDEADFYMMAPNLDNMPGTLIECFASGLPVVSTDAGGIPYILTHEQTGLLAGCDDHRALARHALYLWGNQDVAAAIAARAHQHVQEYTWTHVRERWLTLYQELVAPTVAGNALAASNPQRVD
ncbi:MAG: glycosyltransferase family 4 protein [Nitrospiraceae bacterium]